MKLRVFYKFLIDSIDWGWVFSSDKTDFWVCNPSTLIGNMGIAISRLTHLIKLCSLRCGINHMCPMAKEVKRNFSRRWKGN